MQLIKPTILIALLFLACCYATIAQKTNAPQLAKNNVKQVIAAMTLEEKAKLVVGMGFKMPGVPPPEKTKKDTSIDIGGFVLPPSDPDAYNVPEKVEGSAGRTHAIPRLGIPSITVSDGPAGVRISPVRNGDSSKTYYATAFPVGTLLASSWDTTLVKKVGAAFGNEVLEYGVDILLAPGMNIHRNPLGGRNFEYYSEDPVLTGNIAAAFVNGIQSNGVGTSIKHFAANSQETQRNKVNTIVSERAMREIYLRAFKIAVQKAQPWTVMSSYNKINGTFTSERRDLLTTILKNEWGFKGFVMTDWFGGSDPVAQMNSGNDLIMPGSPDKSLAIIDAVKSGSLKMAQLDENIARILNVILLSPEFRGYKYSNSPDLKNHAEIARKAASEGMILLQNNNNALPFNHISKIAAYGNNSYNLIAGGTGSGDVNKAYTVSLVQGLTNAGYFPDQTLLNNYPPYIILEKSKQPKPKSFFELLPPIPQMPLTDAELEAQANTNDIALFTIGRLAGEGSDRKVDNDFKLSDAEQALLKSISTAYHARNKKLVVILNIGGVIETASWRDEADAILLAWQPGLEAGNAITDVLTGKINPSGKLATTFPMDYQDVPSAKNFPNNAESTPGSISSMDNKNPSVIYEEGIYVGYRYYNTFKVKTAYPFGYGLSYTHFNYTDLKLSSMVFHHSLKATITVTNAGNTAGKEVVQLYLSAPSRLMAKPEEELKGFAKTDLLLPGQSQTITFLINADDLSSFYPKTSSWIADPGVYTIKVAASSMDIKQNAQFRLLNELVTEKVQPVLLPQVPIKELRPLPGK